MIATYDGVRHWNKNAKLFKLHMCNWLCKLAIIITWPPVRHLLPVVTLSIHQKLLHEVLECERKFGSSTIDVWKYSNDQYVSMGHTDPRTGHATLQSTKHPFISVYVCFQQQQIEHVKQE